MKWISKKTYGNNVPVYHLPYHGDCDANTDMHYVSTKCLCELKGHYWLITENPPEEQKCQKCKKIGEKIMIQDKCSICGGDLPKPQYDGDNPPEVNGKPVCYDCWSIEDENSKPIIVNYRMTSYVQGKPNVMQSETVRLDQMPALVDKLFREPGYCVEYVLLNEGEDGYD